MKPLFTEAAEGKNRIFYSIYPDCTGTLWIKFFGRFRCDERQTKKPWRIQEYFGAEATLENFLCISDDPEIVEESLSEIYQTIGNLTDTEALHAMNHFFVEYCFPPDDRDVTVLSIQDLTEDTPGGLYVTTAESTQ